MKTRRGRAPLRQRPERIDTPGPGQESVWDYPRPPRVERERRAVRVELWGELLASTREALRVVETAGAPVYYLPRADVRLEWLEPSPRRSVCEWKGRARYWSVRLDARCIPDVGWEYPDPLPGYTSLRDHLAFYAGRVDACYVGDLRAQPQPGDFYGGWITADLTGPFKGGPGTERW